MGIKAVDVRQSAAEDDYIGVDDIDDHREAARQTIFKAREGRRGVRIAGVGCGRDVGS